MFDDTKRMWFDRIAWTVGAVFAVVLIGTAHAGEHRYPVRDATYRSECGSCHIAYPPALLGAGAWRDIMRGLERHFGTDASVAEAAQARIAAYLAAEAGAERRDARSLRISDARWFRREHDEIAAATWTSTAVKSPANCGACHRQAEQGDFSERSLRVPGRQPR